MLAFEIGNGWSRLLSGIYVICFYVKTKIHDGSEFLKKKKWKFPSCSFLSTTTWTSERDGGRVKTVHNDKLDEKN